MNKLSNFPIMFYAAVMGLGGMCLAYEKLNFIYQISDFLFYFLRGFASAIFLIITTFYLAKLIKFPSKCREEFSHQIKINFFATFSISLLILSILWKSNDAIYQILFYIGIFIQTFLTFYVISFWINNNIATTNLNPAWFIPIVRNLIVVVADKSGGRFAWYYFSVGIFFWLVLFSNIFYRIIFGEQLAKKFMPTLFILIAPPAIAFLDYVKITKNFDTFAIILLNLTIFFSVLPIFLYRNFIKLKFFLSWWAFTFPLAAASLAFLRAYELGAGEIFGYFGIFMFALLLFFIFMVSFFTIKAIMNAQICTDE